MLKVGYGAMVLESLLAVIALCVAGALLLQMVRNRRSRNTIPGLLKRCCRFPGDVWYPGLCSTVLHDHVCIRSGADQSGCM